MTQFAASVFAELEKFKTPTFPKETFKDWEFQDANEELIEFANYIKKHTPHNSDIEPDRIKFLYTQSPKKDAGRYIIGQLIARPAMEKTVNDDFDYFVVVYYPAWKDLDAKQKTIQLDKILCGIDIAPGKDPAEVLFKKKPANVKEFADSISYFGAEDVLKSSEIINLAVGQALEKAKEDAKKEKSGEAVTASVLDEDDDQ